MTHSFILLLYRHMALVILRTILTAVKQELRKFDIAVTATIAFHVIHEASETHQRLLHLLVTVIPLLLAGTDICNPAVSKFLCSLIEPCVTPFSKGIVINCRFNEITCHITLMIAPCLWCPAFLPPGGVTERKCCLQVAVRLLCGKDNRYPLLKSLLHLLLGSNDFPVTLRINHQCYTH